MYLRRYPFGGQIRPRIRYQSRTSDVPIRVRTHRKWLIVTGLARSTRPCTFGVFEEISIQRVDPGPGPESGSRRPATFWTIEPDRVCLRGSEAISVIVQNVYNVAGRDRISSLNNNTWPCNYLEDFVWDWPYHPKFVTIGAVTRIDNNIFTGNEGGQLWH